MRLKGKVAIVTGAARGIGAAIAQRLALEGSPVVLNDLAHEAGAYQLVREIREKGGRAVECLADIADLHQHDTLSNCALSEFGRVDILVNNAAVQTRIAALEAPESEWDRIMAVDLKGPYFLSQRIAALMKDSGGGAILNISSVHDERAHWHNSVYTIAKGGLKLMTRCLALEWAQYGIRVNALSPGAILTDINREALADETFRAKVLESIPLERFGSAEELAGAAMLLVSEEGSYITGTTLYVDGGFLL